MHFIRALNYLISMNFDRVNSAGIVEAHLGLSRSIYITSIQSPPSDVPRQLTSHLHLGVAALLWVMHGATSNVVFKSEPVLALFSELFNRQLSKWFTIMVEFGA